LTDALTFIGSFSRFDRPALAASQG
jgi:hypothetical protein